MMTIYISNKVNLFTIRIGSVAGILSIICYFGSAFLPVPDNISYGLAFAFGPLLILSFLSNYYSFINQKYGPELLFSTVFGILAGFSLALMLFIQIANNIWHSNAIEVGLVAEEKAIYKAIYYGVNRVQGAIDVVMDVFITLSVIFLGICLLRNSLSNIILGSSGIIIAGLLLGLNMISFPNVPADAGLFDAGPLLGIWFLLFFIIQSFRSFKIYVYYK